MPHDRRGEELKVGDTVMVPCVIKAIHLTEDYCNVDLETKLTMPPLGTPTKLTLNSRQTDKPTASHRYRGYGEVCEGCGSKAVAGHTLDDVPLCSPCGRELVESIKRKRASTPPTQE